MIYCITAYVYGHKQRPQLYELSFPPETTREEAREQATTWLAKAHPEQKLWNIEALPNAKPRDPESPPVTVSVSPPIAYDRFRWLNLN